MTFKTMIAIGLSPNTQTDDVLLAMKVLFMPWQWVGGSAIKGLEDWFKRYFKRGFAIAFDSGRSSEYAILRALDVKEGDEVLIQAFTCVAVPNSILWAKATPVFVDVDETGNLDPLDLQKKISAKSRALIVQHTFGIPANMDKILSIAKKHNLVLIEDCAHSLGATYHGKKVGTFGDVAFFSFGRDKIISSVCGGMVLVQNKRLAQKIRSFQRNLSFPSVPWIFAQIFHPIAFSFILPLYNLEIGKVLLVFFQRIGFLRLPIGPLEREGKRPSFYPRRLPNAQAILALHQLKKLAQYNKKRQEIAAMYEQNLRMLKLAHSKPYAGSIFLRYNIQMENPDELYRFARAHSILFGKWYSHIIDPMGVNLEAVGYKVGSCPRAEVLGGKSLNLPTYPRMRMKDAEKVVDVIEEYFSKE